MKKLHLRSIGFLLIAALFCPFSCSISTAAASSVYGDLNGDKSVNAIDFALLKKYLLDNTYTFPAENGSKYADLNGDGTVSVLDYALLKSYLLGKINTFPAEAMINANIPWDWAGVIGTGQSLSVGVQGTPIETTTQPFNNITLSIKNLTVPPFDVNDASLEMVPLIEPVHNYATGYPSPYPGNICGETHHSAMANQITSLVRSAFGKDYITAHTVVGESGQGIVALRKGATDNGSTGRAYAATLFEVNAIKRLAAEAGKTYGVGAITIVHGETDSGNTLYENELHTLWSDYNQDIKVITGQTQSIPLLVVQQHSCGGNGTSASLLAQWRVGVDYPGDIICIGPNYQNFYADDGVHLTAKGYQQLGEQYAKVYYQKVVLGKDWQPLQPTGVGRTGNVIRVNFNVPEGPLVWDTNLPEPNQNNYGEWKNGKGFEVSASNKRITISSVQISGNSVLITCDGELPSTGLKVGYAFNAEGTKRPGGTYRWGLLRDSDQFKGYTSGNVISNYCVSFEMDVN